VRKTTLCARRAPPWHRLNPTRSNLSKAAAWVGERSYVWGLMEPDHYALLGVAPDADRAEIRSAYLRIMRVHHPDRREGDAEAHQTARRANAAWEVLDDPARRQRYDRQRAAEDVVLRVAGAAGSSTITHPRPAAYSTATRTTVARDFQAACLRSGIGVVAGGLLLTLLTTVS
jgi:hypothetical protein